jgi:hypothetical protein
MCLCTCSAFFVSKRLAIYLILLQRLVLAFLAVSSASLRGERMHALCSRFSDLCGGFVKGVSG